MGRETLPRTKISELRRRAHGQSQSFDFFNLPREDLEEPGYNGPTWDYWEATVCQDCGKATNAYGVCSTDACNGDPSTSGPVSQWWWPIEGSDFDFEGAALALADLPVCVVAVDGVFGLSLTGGGMDLSWELADAFTRLGILPPLDVATGLHARADYHRTARVRYLIGAARRALRFEIEVLRNQLRYFEDKMKSIN
jgi:hypothetical protein